MTGFLEECSTADLRRFAICWLTSDKNCDWAKAASLYDPKVQVASFKTVTGRAAVKATKGTELEGFSSGGAGAAAGKKRKGAAAPAEDGEEPAPKKKTGGRKKKAATEEPEEEPAAEEEIKGEEDGELE